MRYALTARMLDIRNFLENPFGRSGVFALASYPQMSVCLYVGKEDMMNQPSR